MMSWSSMHATILTEPPQRPQTPMSILNTRLSRCAQVNSPERAEIYKKRVELLRRRYETYTTDFAQGLVEFKDQIKLLDGIKFPEEPEAKDPEAELDDPSDNPAFHVVRNQCYTIRNGQITAKVAKRTPFFEYTKRSDETALFGRQDRLVFQPGGSCQQRCRVH